MTFSTTAVSEEMYKDQPAVAQTQDVVPALIEQLRQATIEVLQNSNGPPLTFHRDPHLRLRRTLTPRSAVTGIKKYSEAQFVIHPTTGQRRTLHFEALGKHEFLMDAYFWGASEQEATLRMVALHGISPTASRERWHALGHRIQQDPILSKKVRFVALDWHSIDRGDAYQEEFLTLLPKHIFDVPPDDVVKEISEMLPPTQGEGMVRLFAHCKQHCARPLSDGAEIFRAVITQGLGWGTSPSKSFIPCIKSWSGGVGMQMLYQAGLDDDVDPTFRQSIMGVVIMHPATFSLTPAQIRQAMSNLPALMVWAKDDHLVPYPLSKRYLNHDDVQLVTYETGQHGSFDGSSPDDPNFDDNILAWIQEKYL
jgi:hypothetical protein